MSGQGYRERDSRERDYRRPEREPRDFRGRERDPRDRGRDGRDGREMRDQRMDYPPPRGRDQYPGMATCHVAAHCGMGMAWHVAAGAGGKSLPRFRFSFLLSFCFIDSSCLIHLIHCSSSFFHSFLPSSVFLLVKLTGDRYEDRRGDVRQRADSRDFQDCPSCSLNSM